MQEAEAQGPEIQAPFGDKHIDAAENDLANAQIADIAQRVFAGVDQGQSVEYEAGRGHQVPLGMIEQPRYEDTSGGQGDGHIDRQLAGSMVPDRKMAFSCLAPGEPGGRDKSSDQDDGGQYSQLQFQAMNFGEVVPIAGDDAIPSIIRLQPASGDPCADQGADAGTDAAETAKRYEAGRPFHHAFDVPESF